ncbi:hypothetical protein HELRODRAFT_177888 [Helobdella robusta]|uniref:Peptidase S1 domain-containing protein n=1 Tax=Helobdella robusta TaxID=6412 RepID=T1FCF4_HELRO|nr:hypothetical protein HELRODRAFT_177888 [Helobdella robusta]ESN97467.1 hypothetical protein HELRODRAFT_177888 [Helobdella robusta]
MDVITTGQCHATWKDKVTEKQICLLDLKDHSSVACNTTDLSIDLARNLLIEGSLVLSKLDYCSSVIFGISQMQKRKLMNRVARVVTKYDICIIKFEKPSLASISLSCSVQNGCRCLQGDEGGPLVCEESPKKWKLVGVASWGSSYCNPLRPSVLAGSLPTTSGSILRSIPNLGKPLSPCARNLAGPQLKRIIF